MPGAPGVPAPQVAGTRLPLGERALVLRSAVQLVQRHMTAGRLLHGACRS